MPSLLPDARLAEVGVDWITATSMEVDKCEAMLELAERTVDGQRAQGFLPKKAGFQGYAGFGIEGLFVGTRQGGACLRASGSLASHLAPGVARIGPHITRLDTQVTLQADDDDQELVRRFLYEWRREHTVPGGANQLRTQLIDADSRGCTACVGSRSAAFFGRIYDKHRESGGKYPPGNYRIESELKRGLASPAFERLAGFSFSGQAITSMMRRQWQRLGVYLRLDDSLEVEPPIVPRVTSDVERKLKWLEGVAAKVYRELYEHGYEEEASSAMFGWLMPATEG